MQLSVWTTLKNMFADSATKETAAHVVNYQGEDNLYLSAKDEPLWRKARARLERKAGGSE